MNFISLRDKLLSTKEEGGYQKLPPGIVHLNSITQGGPLFILHDITGKVDVYQPLCDHINVPCYGIYKHPAARSVSSIEEMTSTYTVHNAFQEVDDAFLSFKKNQHILFTMQENANNTTTNYKVEKLQYKTGQIDYATYLNYELLMLQSESALTNQNLLVYIDIIQLYKALGMRFN